MANKFEVTYGNDDGYVGGDRPHTFHISEGDLFGDETAEDLSKFFWETIEIDFDNNHKYLHSDQESEFIEWALAANKAAREEE